MYPPRNKIAQISLWSNLVSSSTLSTFDEVGEAKLKTNIKSNKTNWGSWQSREKQYLVQGKMLIFCPCQQVPSSQCFIAIVVRGFYNNKCVRITYRAIRVFILQKLCCFKTTSLPCLPFLLSNAALHSCPNKRAIPSWRSKTQDKATSGDPLAVTC